MVWWRYSAFRKINHILLYIHTLDIIHLVRIRVIGIIVVNCLEWAPQEYGALLASVSSDGNMAILFQTSQWFLHSLLVDEKKWEHQLISVSGTGCSALSWCPYRPNSRECYRIAVAAGDSCIHIFKAFNSPLQTWNLEYKLRGHTDRVRDLAWCPFVGMTTSYIASCGRVW